MRTLTLVVALLAVVAAKAQDDAYKLKIKASPDAGGSMVVREESNEQTAMTVKSEDGKVLKQEKKTEKKQLDYTVTVTEKKGRTPVKYTRVYAKAATTVGDKRVPHSYEGRTVVYEQKGKTFVVRAEGKPELAKRDVDKLTKEANDALRGDIDEMLLPDKAVKVGEGWTLPEKAMTRLSEDVGEVDRKKSQGKAKLLKVYRKGKQTWGIIEFEIGLVMTKAQGLELVKPGSLRLKGTLETAIDGSSIAGTMKGTITAEILAKVKSDEGTVLVEVKNEATSTTTRADKK